MLSVSLAAAHGRRAATLDLAIELERQGVDAFHLPSSGDPVSLALSLAHVTSRARIRTSIAPIDLRSPADLAEAADYCAEISGGRFSLGLGVGHRPRAKGVPGPVPQMRAYLHAMRQHADVQGRQLPQIHLAALRPRMVELALDTADGLIIANASRQHLAKHAPSWRHRNKTAAVSVMVPTAPIDDLDAARTLHRRTLDAYLALPNYRNYWRTAGYATMIDAVEHRIAGGGPEMLSDLMSDDWVDDVTLTGTGSHLRAGIEHWRSAGATEVILVPSVPDGGSHSALRRLLEAL